MMDEKKGRGRQRKQGGRGEPTHITVNQRVHVGDDLRSLDIHKSKRGCDGVASKGKGDAKGFSVVVSRASCFPESSQAKSSRGKIDSSTHPPPPSIPVHAPLALPGLMKNLPSLSKLSKR